MSLADLAARPGPAHRQCAVCWLLTTLDTEPRDHVIAAMSNTAVRYKEIAAAVANEYGHAIPGDTYSRHARGECGAKALRSLP